MRVSRLYLDAELQPQARLPLTKEQAHYALTVLRLKNGAQIEAFDGRGNLAFGHLEHTSRRSADFIIDKVIQDSKESPINTVLVQGISRGDRMDYSIQKAVELGVTAIQPIFTERCEVKLPGEKLEKRRQQWQSIVINACEQNGRNTVPTILPIVSFQDWLKTQESNYCLVLDPYAKDGLARLTQPSIDTPIHLLIGPEGGLTDSEVSQATQAGATAIRLGPRVLRTETAGPTVLAVLQALWGDLG